MLLLLYPSVPFGQRCTSVNFSACGPKRTLSVKITNMAITKSAKKALRQSKRRNVMNVQQKKKVKTLLKEVKVLVGQKKAAEAKKLLPQVYKALDKTAKKKTIKNNNASRRKSRIAKMINKAAAAK